MKPELKQNSNLYGYSLVEILGVLALVAVLTAFALTGFGNFSSLAKETTATKNAASLNAAIEQFNQSGGLMTAQVQRTGATANLSDLPEIRAFCLLASNSMGGPFLAAHQYPIISSDPKDYRVVYISGVNTSSPEDWSKVIKTASGLRNPELEQAIEDGSVLPAQFVVIGPNIPLPPGITDTTPGIVSISRNGTNLCEPNTTSLLTPPPNQTVTITLAASPPEAGTISGSGSYPQGTTVNYSAASNVGWVFDRWNQDLLGSPKNGSLVAASNIQATALFVRQEYEVILTSEPAEGGTITGSGTYKHGETLNYAITPSTSYTFEGWEGDITGNNLTGALVITAPIKATARFSSATYPVTIASGVGGSTNPSAGDYIMPAGKNFRILATPSWSDNWNTIRYRWNAFEVTTNVTGFTTTEQDLSIAVDSPLTIQPSFVRQQFVRARTNNPNWGTIAVNGNTINFDTLEAFDRGSSITVTASPIAGLSRFVRWSDGNTNPTRTVVLNNDIEFNAIFSDMQTVTLRVLDQAGAAAVPASYQILGAAIGNFNARIGEPLAFSFIPRNPTTGIGGTRSYTYSSTTGPVTVTPRQGGAANYGVNITLVPTSNASDVVTINVNTMTFTYYYTDTVQHYGSGRWRPGYQWHNAGYHFWVVNEVQYFLGPFGNPVYYSTSGNHNQISTVRRSYSSSPPGTAVTSFSPAIPADTYYQQGSSAGLLPWNPTHVHMWGSWH